MNKGVKILLNIIIIILLSIILSIAYNKIEDYKQYKFEQANSLYDENGNPLPHVYPSYLTHIIWEGTDISDNLKKVTEIYTFDKDNKCIGIRVIEESDNKDYIKTSFENLTREDSNYKNVSMTETTIKYTESGHSATKDDVIKMLNESNSSYIEY